MLSEGDTIRNWLLSHKVMNAVVFLVIILGVIVLVVSQAKNHNNSLPSATGTVANSNNSVPLEATDSAQVQPCTSHEAITSREWLEIAKDPDSHAGNCVVVYGEVTQFDSATGNNAFRADIDGVEQTPQYGFVNYSTNTVLIGDSYSLRDVVQYDLFKAEVTVLGSKTYQTQMGGQTVVPELRVDSISTTGHLSS